MSKIHWKSKEQLYDEQKERKEKQKEREKFKGKEFKNLSQKEKDELLEKIARQLGYI